MRRFMLLALAGLLVPAVHPDQDSIPTPYQVLRIVDSLNARLEIAGSELRVGEVWFFTMGRGIDPYRRLRTGLRWYKTSVRYMLDESDYYDELPASTVDSALANSYGTWNGVPNATITTARISDDGSNNDILDAVVLDGGGSCVDIVDTDSPRLIEYNPSTGAFAIDPAADVVFGGWINSDYFSKCLGNDAIIGVTWSFYGGDSNHDNYPDLVYVEQFFNPAFGWTTTDAVYLDFTSPMDIETIALHENGHALGLGHFGGPNLRQPFKIQPNLRVFDPEAVMNPYYLGGEKRVLYPTDMAALRALYGRKK